MGSGSSILLRMLATQQARMKMATLLMMTARDNHMSRTSFRCLSECLPG